MRKLSAIAALCLAFALTARAQTPDDQYVHIYNLIQQADGLNNTGQSTSALTSYLEAQGDLQKFQKVYPDWNVKVVNFRLNYLSKKITAITDRVNAAVPADALPVPPTRPLQIEKLLTSVEKAVSPPAPQPDARLVSLQAEVGRLQQDKALLEAKIKEALATQPASADPKELGKAQDRVQELTKENELLKASIEQAQAKQAAGEEAKALADARQALTEANKKISELAERTSSLVIEKRVLQNRLDALPPTTGNIETIDITKRALDDANAKLIEQNNRAAKIAADKQALEEKLKELGAKADAADALRAENELLKKQVADAKANDRSADLKKAEARIAVLQSDADVLRLEKATLESRIKALSEKPPVAVAKGSPEDADRVKKLERERDDLRKKLDVANKELYGRKARGAAAKIEELTTQVAMLRARVEIYEAKPVPYTADELALFSVARPQELAAVDPKAGKKSARELPAGTASLAAEAQRDFSAKNFDKAESKYQEIVSKDDKNAHTLANLAAIQLEQGHLDVAETNILKALDSAPADGYALSILGYLRYRQEKYDDALDALGRAAKLNPDNAEVQNFLGVTLGHKGMRKPAEEALRRAVTLRPNYGDAHANLAVLYTAQQPPWIALARWHYQKALAAGHARNADLEALFDKKSGTPAPAAPTL